MDARALTTQPGYPGLRGQIALRWVDGESPDEVLRQATWWQNEAELLASEDPAAELARNVSRSGPAPVAIGPLSWLSAAPDSLRDHPESGPYLDRMAAVISDLEVAATQPTDRPPSSRAGSVRSAPTRPAATSFASPWSANAGDRPLTTGVTRPSGDTSSRAQNLRSQVEACRSGH